MLIFDDAMKRHVSVQMPYPYGHYRLHKFSQMMSIDQVETSLQWLLSYSKILQVMASPS